jgi:predicted ArsR family transcriptional regulator
MAPSTSYQILEYLNHNRSATARELSDLLQRTKADIQHHLQTLSRSGEILALSDLDAGQPRRGRPELRYRLAPVHTPNNLIQLTSGLLTILLGLFRSPEEREKIYFEIATLMFPNVPPPGLTSRTLNGAVKQLDQHHYQARWEARRLGPCVMLRRCPYAAVLPEHPELCELDTVILSHLLGQKITLVSKMKSEQPDSICVFQSQ